MSGDADDAFDFDCTTRRDLPALPPQDRRLVDRRREQFPELLKAHPVIGFPVLGDGRCVSHVVICCISCNFIQAKKLHDAITLNNWRIDKVAP